MSDFMPNMPMAGANPMDDALPIPDAWFEQEPKFEKVAPGTYTVKVSNREVYQKAGSDKVQFKWTLTIVDGQFAGKDLINFTTVGIKDAAGNLQTSPDSWRYTAMLKAIGATPELMPEAVTERGFAPKTQDLINRLLVVDVVHNGDYVNVRKVKPFAELGKVFDGVISRNEPNMPPF